MSLRGGMTGIVGGDTGGVRGSVTFCPASLTGGVLHPQRLQPPHLWDCKHAGQGPSLQVQCPRAGPAAVASGGVLELEGLAPAFPAEGEPGPWGESPYGRTTARPLPEQLRPAC